MAGMGESSEFGDGLFTDEQVEILEQVYHDHECRKPSQSERLEMINEYPQLSSLDSKEIKLWFQNQRLQEMQKKKDMESMALRDKLTATQQLLLIENAQLKLELLQLENEKEYIQHLMKNASSSNTDQRCESATNPHSLEAADNSSRSFLLAEESHTKILTVSKRCTIGWLPTPRMKASHFHCIVQLVEEKSGKLTPLHNRESVLLSFSQLSTGSNGNRQSLMYCDAAMSLNMVMNSIKKLGTISSFTAALSFPGTVLCVQASLLLKCEKQEMVIGKSTENLEDNLDVQCLMTPVKLGSIEASLLAEWICKSFRSNEGGILLKSNGQSQQSVWKWLWYIKNMDY